MGRAACAGARSAHLAHRLAGAALQERLEGRVAVERGVGLVEMQGLDEGDLGAPPRPAAAVERERTEQRLLELPPLVPRLRHDLVRQRGGDGGAGATLDLRRRGGAGAVR